MATANFMMRRSRAAGSGLWLLALRCYLAGSVAAVAAAESAEDGCNGAGCAQHTGAGRETGEDAHMLLLQTSVKLEKMEKSFATDAEFAHLDTSVNRSHSEHATTRVRASCAQLGWVYEPYAAMAQPQLNIEMLRSVGMLPQRVADCSAFAGEYNHQHAVLLESGGTIIQPDGYTPHTPLAVHAVFFGFVAFFALVVFCMLRPGVPAKAVAVTPNTRSEMESWDRGLVSWLSIEWVNLWVTRWGSLDSSQTQIKAYMLGAHGDPDDDCHKQAEKFERILHEEQENGREHAFRRALFRYITYRKLTAIVLTTGIYEVILYVAPTFAINWTLDQIAWMYEMEMQGVVLTSWQRVRPMIGVIIMFAGFPILMAATMSLNFMLVQRLALRLQGALCGAIYRKAQRLPLGKSSSFDVTPSSWQVAEEDWGWPIPREYKSYSLVSLINLDVNQTLVYFVVVVARVFFIIPVLITLVLLLAFSLGKALFFPILVAVAVAGTVWKVGTYSVLATRDFSNLAGKRISVFQEILFAIRVVKSYAWEPAAWAKVKEARDKEVEAMWNFYLWSGVAFMIMIAYPKVLILVSVTGYVLMYGDVGGEQIFMLMQAVNAFKGASASFQAALPAVLWAGPLFERLENFFRLEEAQRYSSQGDLKDAKKRLASDKQLIGANWMLEWPHRRDSVLEETLSDSSHRGNAQLPVLYDVGHPGVQPMLRLQGSFAWAPDCPPSLKNIDLCIRQGERVAVVGEVGCGKSTLLQAFLREMEPLGDSRIEVPGRIAYHAQVPLIIEGTIRDNIVFWQTAHDPDRYDEAINAAALRSDLQVLPGGDQMLIGTRGIALSGGQRARVSLARAAYNAHTDLVLLDDPFASVDAPTATHIFGELVMGSLLRGRTTIVVCHATPERLQHFDRIVIMANGEIVAQGKPGEILRSTHFQQLLAQEAALAAEGFEREVTDASQPEEASRAKEQAAAGPMDPMSPPGAAGREESPAVMVLREEENEGRADWNTVKFFMNHGMWRNIITNILAYIAYATLSLFSDIVFAKWASSKVYVGPVEPATFYLARYATWYGLALCCYVVCLISINIFNYNNSVGVHELLLNRLLRAPIDRFYDKTPVGRVLSRMSSDMAAIDRDMSRNLSMIIGLFSFVMLPMAYIHTVLPPICTMFSLPFYAVFVILARRFYNVMIPLRYLERVTRSVSSSFVSDAESCNSTVRAYQVAKASARACLLCFDDMLKADFAVNCAKRWFLNRIYAAYSFFTTVVVLIGVGYPSVLDIGATALVITNAVAIIMNLEWIVESFTTTQLMMVSMNRIQEYSTLPQEADDTKDIDQTLGRVVVRLARLKMARLELVRTGEGGIQVVLPEGQGILLESRDGSSLGLVKGRSWSTLVNDATLTEDHHLVSVTGKGDSAESLALELCEGDSETLVLEFRSTWQIGGAKVEFRNFVTGYADNDVDILRGVSFTVERKNRMAIVGTTGCGKSTLILSLLRILEARSGSIFINDVDISTIGLRLLRRCTGLVPQDPLIFSGTIRSNLDPFEEYLDQQVWDALKAVGLAEYVWNLGAGLHYNVELEGQNLSLGQRQLLCIARMVLRQPSLLLLDECTSAIDPRTQEMVQASLRTAFPSSTLISVAHRLETIADFDAVVVLEMGRVIEKGDVRDLVSTGGVFAQMLKSASQETQRALKAVAKQP